MADKKEFDPEIALWPTKNGNFARVAVTAAVYDMLQKAEIGTALLLKEVPADVREKIEANGKTSPTYKLVILPANAQFANKPQTAKPTAKKVAREDDV